MEGTIMKTQISTLINGRKNVIRNMEDPKYINAKPASSHVGFAGTNRDERNEVAGKVHDENRDGMTIIARGIELILSIAYSVSGKSWSWSCQITEDQYKALGGIYTDGTLKAHSLQINMDCTVTLYSFTRKSDAAAWRQSNMTDLDESFIQIL